MRTMATYSLFRDGWTIEVGGIWIPGSLGLANFVKPDSSKILAEERTSVSRENRAFSAVGESFKTSWAQARKRARLLLRTDKDFGR